jgi:hypothetical protein
LALLSPASVFLAPPKFSTAGPDGWRGQIQVFHGHAR